DPLDDPKPHALTDRYLLPDEIEFAPPRPTAHVDIAAEAQRMDGCADYVLDSGHRGQVDDRDHLARNVGETEAGCMQHLGRPAQFIGAEDCKESFDRRTTFRR